MQEFITFVIIGLATGGIYAITAGGLTLTYTTTGIFNFAHGATGMFSAFLYWQFEHAWGWPVWLALPVVLLGFAPLFGIALHLVIMRRLEGASQATKLMVTVAILLSLVAADLWIWDPSVNRTVLPFYAGHVWKVGGVNLAYADLITLGVALAVAVALWILLTRTRIGVAMRATVDDRSLAVLNGSRPEASGMLAWAIGTSLAALAGILVAPKLSLSPLPLTLLIVNAYAAAVIGRLRSLPMTFVGAMVIGVAGALATNYVPKWDAGYPYLAGFIGSVPVVVLFIALLLMPQSQLRGHASTRTREFSRKPTWTGGAMFAAAVVFGGIVASRTLSDNDVFSSTKMWGLGIIGLSMIPLIGYAGQLSLAQLGFAGIGAITVAHLGREGQPIALLWAALICAAVGAVVALPALRLSGIYLALATAAFAVALDRWFFLLPKWHWGHHEYYVFKSGSLQIKRFDLPGVDITGDRAYFVFGAVAFALVSLLVVAIRRAEFGKRLLALKDSPAACATLGMNHKLTTLAVFATSAAIAGVGGGIYGGAVRSVSPNNFEFFTGLSILMSMVIAGLTSPGAALFAGTLLGTPLMINLFPDWTQLTTILIGLNGVALGRNPNGMVAAQLRPKWDPALKHPFVLAGGAAVIVAAFAVRQADLVGNWVMVIVIALSVVLISSVSRGIDNRKSGAPGGQPVLPEGMTAPPEKLGLSVPFTPEDIEALDRTLGLPPLTALSGGRHGS
ncbi:ABC transporter permease [Yinghuangia seranimata]|uniref:ABC transporter permease n=1 Tax=Yinghuangia seranimata TaxID=408067 RepID=UPI00248D14A3|nr:ABC transporter permease [Yinghuangia seranimata]MDI2131600.1 ABC transporter permease [Yinghuangia seranimata]